MTGMVNEAARTTIPNRVANCLFVICMPVTFFIFILHSLTSSAAATTATAASTTTESATTAAEAATTAAETGSSAHAVHSGGTAMIEPTKCAAVPADG